MAISLGGFSGGSAAATDTLDDVTGRGATTTNAVTVGGLSIGTAYTMPTADGSANQVLSTDGSGAISFSTLNITGGLEYKGDYTGQSLVTAEKGDFYVVNGSQTLAGVSLNTNDHIVFSADAADPVTTAMFDVIDNTDAVSSVNGQTGPVSLGVGNLSDVTITGAASGEVLKYDGSAWVDAQVAYSEVSGTPTLGTAAAAATTDFLASSASLDDLSDVTITGAASGEVLKYDGSAWVDAQVAYSEVSGTPTNVSDFTNDSGYLTAITGQSIGSLSDVTITGAASGEVLKYDGSAWVDAQVAYSEVSGTPTLGTASAAATTDFLAASAGINDLSDVTITSATSGQVISYNGSAWVNSAASAGSLAGLSDVTITGAASGEVLKYDGSSWVDATLAYSDLSGTPTNVSDFTNDSGYLTAITGQSIGSLSDVTITGAASGEYLRYNGSAWVDAALGIADDSTPSLGGNLDVSGNDIVSASNGAIEIAPDGTGSVIVKGNTASSATNTGHIKLNCENNSHHVKIAAPAHSTYTGGSYTLTLPPDDGGADEVLKTDGSGNLSWVAQSSGGAAPNVTTDSSQSNTTISTSTGIEEVHLISNGASNVVITLPAASTAGSGYKYQVKRLGTGNVSVALNGSEYIDHSAQNTFAIGAQYDSITLCTDGSNWYLI